MPWVGPWVGPGGRQRRKATDIYLTAMAVAPNATVEAALRALIAGWETDGVWTNWSQLAITCLHTEQASRLNARNVALFNLIDMGAAPVWVSGVGGAGGFTADPTAGLNSQWSPLTYSTLNSICVAIDSGTAAASGNFDFGNGSTLSGRIRSGDLAAGRINDGTTETIAAAVPDGSGMIYFYRPDVNTKAVGRNGAQLGSTARASSVLSAGTLKYLWNATTASIRRARLLAVGTWPAGGETAMGAFTTRFATFKTAIGCT